MAKRENRKRGTVYCEGYRWRGSGKFGKRRFIFIAASAIETAYRSSVAGSRIPHTLCLREIDGNLSILKTLAKQGSGFDVVSHELLHLQHIGYRDRIVFSELEIA